MILMKSTPCAQKDDKTSSGFDMVLERKVSFFIWTPLFYTLTICFVGLFEIH